ncbi:MAG: hypothetical protein MUO33_01880, partial [Sedimentisphaerales bacterium]|nr:hypothetical protein [Sedimentisphaerales bacterium]
MSKIFWPLPAEKVGILASVIYANHKTTILTVKNQFYDSKTRKKVNLDAVPGSFKPRLVPRRKTISDAMAKSVCHHRVCQSQFSANTARSNQ